jgi:microcin C transport system ATP-binding protein
MTEKSTQTLLKVDNLSVTFSTQQADVAAVRNISFDIAKGQTVALVGESGSGKSVTALSILRLHDETNVSYPDGAINYLGNDLMQLSANAMRAYRGRKISMIFQEPMTSLNPVHTVGAQLKESLTIHRQLDKIQAEQRSIALLDRVGITEPQRRLNDYPHMLSGGQRQRVMIAMALACDPDLLIADEPTTALDVTIQRQILELLMDIQQERQLSILLITHDLNLVRRYADKVCVMQQGEIVEQGDTSKIFSTPQHAYTKYLLASEPDQRIAMVTPGSERIISASHVKCYFPITSGFFNRQVDVVRAVDDIDVQLNKGETLGIVGESGSGKTTLGMALLRLVDSTGQIKFRGHTISGYQEKQMRPLRRYFQVVFQDPFSSLSPRMTVDQIISEGLKLHFPEMSHSQRQHKIAATLNEVGLDKDVLWRYPHEFSGGQRQRIAIARTMVLEPEVVLLDEPTSALDVSVQKQVLSLLAELQQKHNLSYLFISHDLRVVRAMSHRVIVMRDGKVVEAGEVEAIFDNPQQQYTRELASASLYR